MDLINTSQHLIFQLPRSPTLLPRGKKLAKQLQLVSKIWTTHSIYSPQQENMIA